MIYPFANTFSTPNKYAEQMLIEQAALNNANIITEYDWIIQGSVVQAVKESGLKHKDGTDILVFNWKEMQEGTADIGDNIVLYDPMFILEEMMDLDRFKKVTFVETNDYE